MVEKTQLLFIPLFSAYLVTEDPSYVSSFFLVERLNSQAIRIVLYYVFQCLHC